MVLSRSSTPAADPLSEVMAAVGAGGARRTRLEASGDWALAFPSRPRLKFVALLRGSCCIVLPDHPPQTLAPGDAVLLGRTAYVMASRPGVAPTDGTVLYTESGSEVVRLGGDETVLVGGSVGMADAGAGFVLDALPPFLRVEAALPSAGAITRTLDLLDGEVSVERTGGALVRSRLTEMLLVEAIRASTAGDAAAHAGWIGALGDRQIGAALRLMHGDVRHPWTVAALASRVAMSRSAFSARFSRLVGRPPLEYLTQWRMVLARQLLGEGRRSVGSVARAVGYRSQSAFCQAYRRTFGHSPRSDSIPVQQP